MTSLPFCILQPDRVLLYSMVLSAALDAALRVSHSKPLWVAWSDNEVQHHKQVSYAWVVMHFNELQLP